MILDPKLGGRLRAVAAVVIFVATFVAALLGAVNWDAPLASSIPALLQVLAHYTKLGNAPAGA